ncbi:hypothetical protein A0256_11665 [Mucilaginibacter sp. PAMC 26640]|nr:hypothetical protein A0256_11665 [Mucilaginibacter sp. PAMC 26640]
MPFFHQTANPEAVLRQFLNLLGLSVSKEQLTNEISIHPDYPNLLALNDVANNFGAAANAYRISADDLMEVPCPFIAHTRKKGSEFMLVTAINENEITLTDHLRKKYKTKLSDFTSIFNDVVLIAETVSETAKIASPFKLLSDENKAAIAFFLAFTCFAFAIGLHFIPAVAGWILPVVALLKTAGLAVSVLLLIQSIDKNNPLVQTLCGGGGKTYCNAILTSNAANVFEGLTWSEVGFFYFTSTWLAVLFGGGNLALLQLLAVLNIISLPYTFYSIYYQWRIAKQWCVFCCAVQALLWLEFIPLVSVLGQPFQILNFSGVIGLLICLSAQVAAWWLLKPLILKVQQLQPLKTQLQKVKYNIQQFNRLLQEQPK